MVRLKPKKRGPKYSVGEGKRRLLLITLNHPDGIDESSLINEIKEKLSFTSPRGIKGHLDDLGPGRTIKKKWIEGKHYLIKIPSKFEPKATKKRLIKDQGIEEIDIDNLPEENIWKSNPDFEIFKQIADELLSDKNHALPFVQSEYTQKMIKEHCIEDIRKIDPKFAEFLEEVIRYSPTTVKASLLESDVLKNAYSYKKINDYFHKKYQIENDPMFDAIIGCVVIDYILNPGMRERIDSLISPPKVSEEEKEEFLKKLRVSTGKTKILGSS